MCISAQQILNGYYAGKTNGGGSPVPNNRPAMSPGPVASTIEQPTEVRKRQQQINSSTMLGTQPIPGSGASTVRPTLLGQAG